MARCARGRVRTVRAGLSDTSSAKSVDDYDYLEQTPSLCYSCTVIQSIHEEHDHFQGPRGCADPFDYAEILSVECDDQCAVSSIVLPSLLLLSVNLYSVNQPGVKASKSDIRLREV